MLSIGFSMKLIVVVFAGFVLQVACHAKQRKCFNVESKTICYFMPNLSSVDWDTAWRTCKELNATLPVILSEKGQLELRDFVGDYLSIQAVWTAGRYVGSKWSWLNGQDLSGTEKPSCSRNQRSCVHETQSVLTKELTYSARYPNYTYIFICSFPGVNCPTETQNSIKWKGGCLNWKNNHRLRLNEARNECLKGGGDLATFSEKEDLDRLREFPTFLSNAVNDHQGASTVQGDADNGFWIGLHRKWWIWNTTDVHDIKFNSLDDYGETGMDCLFIDGHIKLSRDKCSAIKNVICQTETRELNSADEPFPAPMVVGVVIVVLAVAITVVILLIFIRKRWRVAEAKRDAETVIDPIIPSQNTIVQSSDDTYATIDDDMETLNYANGPNTSDNPVYSEVAGFFDSEMYSSTAPYLDP